MAGPYRPVDGHPDWVAVDPAELVAETRRMLHEDGGVRLAEHVAKELRTLGMADDHVAAWLGDQPVRIADGLVVAMTGTPADVAERALHARGRPMSMRRAGGLAAGRTRGRRDAVVGSDRRFVVGDDDALALAEWADTPTGGLELHDRPAGTLHVTVDDAVLAGASGPVPRTIARALGLRPGCSSDVRHPLRAGCRGRRRPGCDPRIAAPGRARRRRGDRGRAGHRALR